MPVIYRYFSGDSFTLFPNGTGTGFPSSTTSLFVPTPPSILQLTNQQLFRSPRRTSSSSLPGRLNRALSLGTIPSLARAGKAVERRGPLDLDSFHSKYFGGGSLILFLDTVGQICSTAAGKRSLFWLWYLIYLGKLRLFSCLNLKPLPFRGWWQDDAVTFFKDRPLLAEPSRFKLFCSCFLDSGYLFSGSRPASQSSQSKESPTSGNALRLLNEHLCRICSG